MMRRLLAVAAVTTLLPVASVQSETQLPQVIQVAGQVTAAARPVEDVLIVAFGLKSFESHQSLSDHGGAFRLQSLPSDVYRLIAVKRGFAPAVATIVPSAPDLRVSIKLKEGKVSSEAANQIWEIRRSLPTDVLRELDAVMAPPIDLAQDQPSGFRFRGQMESLTGVTPQESSADWAQTAVEFNGSANGWSVDIAGRMHQVQNTDDLASGKAAQSRGIVMALQTSPRQSLRIATMRNWWKLGEDVSDAGDAAADVESHRIEWTRPDSNVEVRYLSQQNLFRSPTMNSETFAVAGRKQFLESDRTNLNVDFQVWQENALNADEMPEPYRIANIGTSGHFAPTDGFDFRYGLRTRFTNVAQQWSPETGAEIRIAKRTSLVVSGLYTVGRSIDSPTLPIVTSTQDFRSISPRYRYSFGLVSGDPKGDQFSAIMTVAAVDSMISMLFDDPAATGSTWDGYLLKAGDLHRDVTLTYRKNIANDVLVDVTATAAQTDSPGETKTKHYVISNVRTYYRPSGTSMEVTYRLAEQPQQDVSRIDANGERLNLRVAQSLHLPLDLRLLLGVDLAREHAVMTDLPQDLQRRYLGGLALAF